MLVPAAIYVALITWLGIYLSSALFVAFFMRWLGKYVWWKVAAGSIGNSVVFFLILKNTVGMRSKEEHEIAGLDLPEMGALAYPDFLEAQGPVFAPIQAGAVPVSAKALREEVAG